MRDARGSWSARPHFYYTAYGKDLQKEFLPRLERDS
jgi:hypothetical protein